MYQYPYGNAQQLNLDWILGKIQELEAGSVDNVIEEVANALISASYAMQNYNRSDIVFYNGKLYRANQNITAEPWNAAHWDEILLGDTVANLVRYVGSLSNNQVFNSSTVSGTHTSDALDNLKADIDNLDKEIDQISTSFDFYNPNAAYRIANNQGEARTGYTFNADNTITVDKDYSAYGSAYAFNDSLLLTAGKYTVSAFVQTSNLSPLLSSAIRVKLGLSSVAAQYPTLTTTQGGNVPISAGDNAGWLTATFEITEEETFCFLIMPNSTAWNPLTISNLSITGITAYDAEARTDINNLTGAINGTAQSLAPKTTTPSTISIPDKTLFFLGNVLKHAKTQINVGETINSGNSVDFTLNNIVRVIPFQASIYDLDTLKTTLGTAYCFEIASQLAVYVGYFENVSLPVISTMLQIRTLPLGTFGGSTPRLLKGWVYYNNMTGYDLSHFVETQPNTSQYIYPRPNITFSEAKTNQRFSFIQFAFLPSGDL